ncbi:MAG: ACT domain-containing protein [Eubacteriales bacterium]|jgi:chorismate mutase|nr:ACT domain-containing protein [Eubacteriales bacterium]MDY2982393.1 ACT domain-containing protein [Eubacteriales bacterium]
MTGGSDYLIVDKRILPDYYEKVVEARELIRSGRTKDISEAVKTVGISRSTYYKYKDYVFCPSEVNINQKAVISLMLSHVQGALSELLGMLSKAGANILTISQTLPIHSKANVVLSVDMSRMVISMDEMLATLGQARGASNVELVAVE